MHVRRVLDRLQMAGRMAGKAEFADRRGPVGQEPRLERRIAPGARDHGGAALRADLVAIHFDPGVDRGGIDELFLREQAFERLRAQGWLGRQMRMQLVVDMGDRLPVEARHRAFSLAGREQLITRTRRSKGAARLPPSRRGLG